MQLNSKKKSNYTEEGAKAKNITPKQQLKRSVLACMLWENNFYEDGESIVERIASLVPKVKPEDVKSLAIEARTAMKLRHVPLLLVSEMAKHNTHKYLVKETLVAVIQRADELAEFVAIYWKNGKTPLSAQVKKGLAEAFKKFDEYQLAKYSKKGKVISLRDVIRLVHPKPDSKEQEELWGRLLNQELKTPDTWEVALSTCEDKKSEWERLLTENKLGGLALLRNLRNFQRYDVNEGLVLDNIKSMKTDRILPFRFISAANYAPQWEQYLEEAMLKCLSSQDQIPGHTVILVDVSGSMGAPVSEKSDITRLDAACGVSMLLREICDKVDVFTFSMELAQVPGRRGFALKDAICNSQERSGTLLGTAIKSIYAPRDFEVKEMPFGTRTMRVNYKGQNLNPDRLIIITDEQSHDSVPDPEGKAYMINVASNKNGVGYGSYTHIDGWSEAVVNYIREMERGLA